MSLPRMVPADPQASLFFLYLTTGQVQEKRQPFPGGQNPVLTQDAQLQINFASPYSGGNGGGRDAMNSTLL